VGGFSVGEYWDANVNTGMVGKQCQQLCIWLCVLLQNEWCIWW
jgi:hypothetical protein